MARVELLSVVRNYGREVIELDRLRFLVEMAKGSRCSPQAAWKHETPLRQDEPYSLLWSQDYKDLSTCNWSFEREPPKAREQQKYIYTLKPILGVNKTIALSPTEAVEVIFHLNVPKRQIEEPVLQRQLMERPRDVDLHVNWQISQDVSLDDLRARAGRNRRNSEPLKGWDSYPVGDISEFGDDLFAGCS